MIPHCQWEISFQLFFFALCGLVVQIRIISIIDKPCQRFVYKLWEMPVTVFQDFFKFSNPKKEP